MEPSVPVPQFLLCSACQSPNGEAACHLGAVGWHYLLQLSLMSVKAFLFEVVGLVLSSCSDVPASARRFAASFEWPVSSEHLPAPAVVALSWAGVRQ